MSGSIWNPSTPTLIVDPTLRGQLLDPTGGTIVGYDRVGRSVKDQLDMLYAGIANVLDTKFAGGAIGNGVADDTAACQAAHNSGAKYIYYPAGKRYLFKGYVKPVSGQHIELLGTIVLSTKAAVSLASGFDFDTVTGCILDGYGVGTFTDPGVVANYVWNEELKYAPAVHVRRSADVIIRNLVIDYVVQGILSSAQPAAWYPTSASLVSGTVFSTHVTITGCRITHTQIVGIGVSQNYNITVSNNYVYRCGDAGMFVMDSVGAIIEDNVRESPYGNFTATDLTDQQGMALENVQSAVVRDNKVTGLSITGIDIKRGCDDVLVTGNTVRDVQCAPIAVRGGDMANTANNRVTVEANTIIRAGYPHRSDSPFVLPTYSITGGIYSGACKQITIRNNLINSYQVVHAIKCNLAIADFDFYHSSKHESFCKIEGNIISFVTDLGAEPQFNLAANQPDAIYVAGIYDLITVDNNTVHGNKVGLTDARTGSNAGIYIIPDAVNYGVGVQYFPKLMSVKGNKILNFVGFGIRCEPPDNTYAAFSGSFSVSDNQVVNVSYTCLRIVFLKSPLVSGNVCTSGGSTGIPHETVTIAGCPGIIVIGNTIEKRTYPDADLAATALSITGTTVGLYACNRVNGATDFTGSTITSANNI